MVKRKSTIPAVRDHYSSEQSRIGLDRLIFFSDAVFAIAITVLVLDIHLPAGGDTADNRQLLLMLTGLWPKYFAYILSFWVIGLYWISHHRKFLIIKRFDNRLLRLNLLLLMVIAFIPFPTAVMSENGNRTATIFYALVMAFGGLLVFFLWWHAVRNHNLIDAHLDKQFLRREVAAPLATVGIFILSIGIAFVNENLVRLCWMFLIPVSLYLNSRRVAA
jgi:TMEM175 potassium channel family protein